MEVGRGSSTESRRHNNVVSELHIAAEPEGSPVSLIDGELVVCDDVQQPVSEQGKAMVSNE